jgi:hypothetical protein
MTYDRKRVKFDVPAIRALNEQVYGPLPTITRTTLLPTSEEMAQKWRYTVEAPGEDWYTPDFDDTVWKEGEAGFGTNETPNTVVQTEWSTNDLWIRRQFTLDSVAVSELNYRIYHDEDATIYINGRQVDQLAGYASNYENLLASSEAVAALKEGKNLIAIHAKQTKGGQYIDCGLLDVRFESKE